MGNELGDALMDIEKVMIKLKGPQFEPWAKMLGENTGLFVFCLSPHAAIVHGPHGIRGWLERLSFIAQAEQVHDTDGDAIIDADEAR